MNPHRVLGGPRPHAWIPAHPGSALDVCANDCGTRRLTGVFVRGRKPSRFFWVDPGCNTTEPEIGAMVYSCKTHAFEPIAEVGPEDLSWIDKEPQ